MPSLHREGATAIGKYSMDEAKASVDMKTGNSCCGLAKWMLALHMTAGVACCAIGGTGHWNMFERRLGMFVH